MKRLLILSLALTGQLSFAQFSGGMAIPGQGGGNHSPQRPIPPVKASCDFSLKDASNRIIGKQKQLVQGYRFDKPISETYSFGDYSLQFFILQTEKEVKNYIVGYELLENGKSLLKTETKMIVENRDIFYLSLKTKIESNIELSINCISTKQK